MTGLYIHVPFCLSKCPYCDFYSLAAFDDELLDRYTAAVCRAIKQAAPPPSDTLYFGGGTPSLLGGQRLAALIDTAARCGLSPQAEITLEANPADDLADTLRTFAAAGGNRLSLGMQSAVDHELETLGRRHRTADIYRTVEDAHAAGLSNLSLDIMLATPGQTAASVHTAVQTAVECGARHISAYLLKIEPHTPFYRRRHTLDLPDDDAAADRYLLACEALEQAGFSQYEISNFAHPGFESCHNLKYWNSEHYYGFGPAAHSFFGGVRWQYPRDLASFLAGTPPVREDPDSAVADASPEEYALLRLRLTAGLCPTAYRERFHAAIPARWIQNAAALPPTLVRCENGGIRLTRQGFLLENAVIARILEN